MTNQEYENKLDYLMQIKEMESEIYLIELRLKEINASLTSVKVHFSDMPKAATPDHSKMEDGIIRMMGIKEELVNKQIEISDKKREIEETINKLDHPKHRMVLTLRYVSGEKWEDIAAHMGVDRSTVFRYRRKAIEELSIDDNHNT